MATKLDEDGKDPCGKYKGQYKCHRGSCSSGGRANCLVTAGFRSCVLEQESEPQIAPDEQRHTARQPLPSVYERVNVTIVVKCFEAGEKKLSKMTSLT